MRTLSSFTLALTFSAMLLLPQAPALALNNKSWVSNSGLDTNNCATPATACRTFQHAFSVTAAGGEIGVVKPGDYGQLAITHSISITNDSAGEAGFQNPNGTCGPGSQLLTINASAGDIVSVRGLVFDGCNLTGIGPLEDNGILFSNGTALHIQNCVFRNFAAESLSFNTNIRAKLFVSDSIFIHNGIGLAVLPHSTGSADVVLERIEIQGNQFGLLLDSSFATGGNGIHAVLRDGIASGNDIDGIVVTTESLGEPPAFLFMERSSAVENGGIGIRADSPRATVLLSNSKITRNGTGVTATNGGQILTYGNNDNNINVGAEGTATRSLSLF